MLSEGQNLQDADMVINYDIHWNPVRVIQRMGRIDRIGSINKQIYGINFWPSDNINNYLNLQKRIEQRMASMKLAGAEVHIHFSDTLKEIAEDDGLEQKQKERMLLQMESSWDEVEITQQNIGFDSFSLEMYRQDLLEELKQKKDYYQSMPNGIYTGFSAIEASSPQAGVIALLGYPSRLPKSATTSYKAHELLYVNAKGESVLLNQKEVLEALTKQKDCVRDTEGLKAIDQGDTEAIAQLATAINNWILNQGRTLETQEDGTVTEKMGTATLHLLEKIKMGSKQAVKDIKTENTPAQKYKPDNFDLITWFVVNKNN